MQYSSKKALSKIKISSFLILLNLIFLKMPVIGVNVKGLSSLLGDGSMSSFVDSFTGSSLRSLTMGAFSVMSLITVDIVFNLLTMVFPKLEDIKNNGESGKRFYKNITLSFSLILTFIMGFGIVSSSNSFYKADSIFIKILSIGEWVLATFIIGKFAAYNDEEGVGQGINLLIFTNILTNIPKEAKRFLTFDEKTLLVIVPIITISLLLAIFYSYSYIKVYVLENSKVRTEFNEKSFMLVPLAVTSIMPIIYVNSISFMPSFIKGITGIDNKVINTLIRLLTPSMWYENFDIYAVFGILIYIALIFLFAIFFSQMSFPTGQIADNFKNSNTMLKGVRSGSETKLYLDKILRRVVIVSTIMLIIIAVIPQFLIGFLFDGLNIAFMGTSLLLLVNIYSNLDREFCAMFRHLDKKYRI